MMWDKVISYIQGCKSFCACARVLVQHRLILGSFQPWDFFFFFFFFWGGGGGGGIFFSCLNFCCVFCLWILFQSNIVQASALALLSPQSTFRRQISGLGLSTFLHPCRYEYQGYWIMHLVKCDGKCLSVGILCVQILVLGGILTSESWYVLRSYSL